MDCHLSTARNFGVVVGVGSRVHIRHVVRYRTRVRNQHPELEHCTSWTSLALRRQSTFKGISLCLPIPALESTSARWPRCTVVQFRRAHHVKQHRIFAILGQFPRTICRLTVHSVHEIRRCQPFLSCFTSRSRNRCSDASIYGTSQAVVTQYLAGPEFEARAKATGASLALL